MALNTQPLTPPVAPTPALAAIQKAAAAQGLNWRPLAAVAHYESGLRPTALGDGGHAFGLFQNNNAGGTITGDPNPRRFFDPNVSAAYAARAVKALGIQGESPQQQVADIVNRYERPAKPQPEIAGAQSYLAQLGGGMARQPTAMAAAPAAGSAVGTQATAPSLSPLSLAPLQAGLDQSATQNQRALDALGKISHVSTLAQAAPNLAALTSSQSQLQPAAKPAGVTVPLNSKTPHPVEKDPQAAKAIALAKHYIGTPYVFGGESPKGFDCSGLLQFVWSKNGVQIPRTAAEQFKAGKPVSEKDLQPGDAVFFQTEGANAGVTHVAMYVGGGQILEAPHTGQSVKIAPLAGYYQQHLVGARRFA